MSDFTVKKKITTNFTIIQNEIFDADLSIDTIGLYLFLFSLPDDWKLNVAHLKRKFGIGKARVYRMLNELIESGYVERVEVRNEAGQFTSLHYQVNDSLQGSSPQSEEPLTENRDAGNRDAYKELNILSTNSIKKNKSKKVSLPEDWKPSEKDISFAKQKGWSDSDIEEETGKFVTYWTEGNGAGKRRENWSRSWITWINNNYSQKGATNTSPELEAKLKEIFAS